MDAITNSTPQVNRAVPGQYGCRLLNEFDIMLNGHSYFYKKMRKNNSTVIRTNLGKHMTSLCDRKAIETMYDTGKTLKEPSFIKLKLNCNILDGNTPSLFLNGDHHEKIKAFEIELFKMTHGNIFVECISQTVLEYFKKWQESVPGKNFEDELRFLTRDVLSMAFFGGRLDHRQMEIWKKGLFSRIGSNDEKRSKSVLPALIYAIKTLPRIERIRKVSQEIGLPVEETLYHCLFIIGFNIDGCSVTLTSCIAELHLLDDDMKSRLKVEVTNNIQETGLTYSALANMKLLESFVQEVCRLHPAVPIIFGKASKDFTLPSNSGEFLVKEDDALLGEVYICQRDPKIFEDPNRFKADRFHFQERLLEHLLGFGGPYNQAATPTDHKCPGQNIAMDFLKAILVYFITGCQSTLAGSVTWNDKRLKRLSCPDSQLQLKSFVYDDSSVLFKDLKDMKLVDYVAQDV